MHCAKLIFEEFHLISVFISTKERVEIGEKRGWMVDVLGSLDEVVQTARHDGVAATGKQGEIKKIYFHTLCNSRSHVTSHTHALRGELICASRRIEPRNMTASRSDPTDFLSSRVARSQQRPSSNSLLYIKVRKDL